MTYLSKQYHNIYDPKILCSNAGARKKRREIQLNSCNTKIALQRKVAQKLVKACFIMEFKQWILQSNATNKTGITNSMHLNLKIEKKFPNGFFYGLEIFVPFIKRFAFT